MYAIVIALVPTFLALIIGTIESITISSSIPLLDAVKFGLISGFVLSLSLLGLFSYARILSRDYKKTLEKHPYLKQKPEHDRSLSKPKQK
jgi:hypothetical protein